ncbi:single insulin-like growth factor-binding domain protein-1 [Caerostris darwini]|uniref:Single insulin-like growth factor-binding domain protein-1 n=1 Tax=Caerostris darwini TaxID=1538125 RepID=A0AAV4UHM6_9ARAC|nr:single insulin-like growth factor-binding domain protein-1 [Caerostris darwini]
MCYCHVVPSSYICGSTVENMKTTFCLLVGLVLVVSTLALDCPVCFKFKCKDPGPCHLGQTTDVCGCCTVCYKGIGEECGGPWNVFGVCANHLSCIRLPEPEGEDPVHDFNTSGRCFALP